MKLGIRRRSRLRRRYGRSAGGSLYQRLKAAGCKIDHHESDLYVKATPAAVAIVRASGAKGAKTFWDQREGGMWIDVPFMYEPYWEGKSKGKRMGGGR